MRILKKTHLLLLVFLAILCVFECARIPMNRVNHFLNPCQFGLNEARTGKERYYALQRTHDAALKMGAGVSYTGIKEIVLDIPADAKPLPLTHYTDFAGVSIVVNNNKKNFYLFSLSSKLFSVKVDGREIDNKDFSGNSILKSGKKLLVISDKTPWVEKRIGYDYGATRKDIMLVENGKSENGPMQSYCTSASIPDCRYCEVEGSKIVLKDVNFSRTNNSTKKTYFVKIENQYNIELSGIRITTPEGSGLYADKAIDIANCANVTLKDVTINGTYSLPKQYGYGVSMDNVYKLEVDNMFARANWGVFGNNNLQRAILQDCDINRFDIHCYGKDVRFENCNFEDLYNQFSSMYGEVVFENCIFTKFTPVLIEGTYNAYTAFDVVFENCTFNIDKNHTTIFKVYGFSGRENSRPELKQKCLPNIDLRDCRVNVSEGVDKWYVYNTNNLSDYEGRFSYISKVRVERLSTNMKERTISVFSNNINSVNKIQLQLDYFDRE